MAKKLILSVLAGVALLVVADSASSRPRESRYRQDGGHRILHRRRLMAFSPRRGIIIGPTAEEKTIVVCVTNNNGSKTEVKLIAAADGGYTGPKGEYYSTMPSEEQLKALYGLPCAAPVRNNFIVCFDSGDGVEIVVVLTKDGSEYVGPKGERYQNIPTEEQLRLIYDK